MAVLLLVPALLTLSCQSDQSGGSPASTAASSPTSTYSPTAPANLYSLDTRTGLAGIDHFLDLLQKQDFAKMASEATFKDVGCRNAVDGYPLCEGLPEDARRTVFLMAGCKPWFAYSTSELERNLAGILAAGEPFFIFAVGDMAPVPPDAIGVVGWTGKHDVILRRAGTLLYELNIQLDQDGRMQSVTNCAQDLWKLFRPILPPK